MSDSIKLTDKRAICIALHIAIDTEESLIDAYTNSYTGEYVNEGIVADTKKRIDAFKRVLDRYYGGYRNPIAEQMKGKPVSILKLMNGWPDESA